MTTTPPEAPSGPPPQDPTRDTGPRVDRDQVRDLGRLRRSTADRKVAGVAGGLGRHLDVDPLILRVAFVVFVFFGGAGLILYGACWLLVPEDGDDKAPFNLDERTRTVALVIVGGIAALALIGDSWGAFWFPWPIAIVALVALWLLTRNSTTKAATPPTEPTYASGPTPTYQPTAAYQPPAAPAYYPPQQPTQPPPYVVPPVVQRFPNPRKRGPILFWFTLALIALCSGLLGMADLAGANIADGAYPALAVGICGVMLLVGAFFGRAGGIILAGLIATVGLVGATAAHEWDGDQVTVTPTSAASLEDRYWLDAGEQVVDLRDVTDLSSLAGQTLEVEGGVGRIEIILPAGLAATVTADVDGPGDIVLFGEEHGGINVSENDYDGFDSDPELTITTHLGVGQIEVHR
jgi:phage shock protein PspC (stress-responsive transcriptional regulator)